MIMNIILENTKTPTQYADARNDMTLRRSHRRVQTVQTRPTSRRPDRPTSRHAPTIDLLTPRRFDNTPMYLDCPDVPATLLTLPQTITTGKLRSISRQMLGLHKGLQHPCQRPNAADVP